jgi:hypothetical protein
LSLRDQKIRELLRTPYQIKDWLKSNKNETELKDWNTLKKHLKLLQGYPNQLPALPHQSFHKCKHLREQFALEMATP